VDVLATVNRQIEPNELGSEVTTVEPSPGRGSIHVLLIDDDLGLAAQTARYLQEHSIVPTVAIDAAAGLTQALRDPYDVVLLDLVLRGLDGLTICREIRMRRDVPLIIVTACREEADCVLLLESGADEYITKPFSSRELVARIHAVVRRSRGQAGPPSHPVRAGGLVLEPSSLCATLDGRPLQLTAYEWTVLRALAERAGRVLSRQQLLELAKGDAEGAFDRSIDVQISRLRHKLGDDPRAPRIIKTIRGAGYMLTTEGSSPPGP
jgi:DNA-binding response OmpR family regulator